MFFILIFIPQQHNITTIPGRHNSIDALWPQVYKTQDWSGQCAKLLNKESHCYTRGARVQRRARPKPSEVASRTVLYRTSRDRQIRSMLEWSENVRRHCTYTSYNYIVAVQRCSSCNYNIAHAHACKKALLIAMMAHYS